jgi:CheY-like chemotaxis protein
MANILVMDDDEELRQVLLNMLHEIGHAAVAATNGLDGLKQFRAAPCDLIITDMMMPYGGLATIRMLRAEFPKLGIIAMSGGGAHRLDFARGTGANTTLKKPFTIEQLKSAIAHAIEGVPPPKPAI